MVQRSPSASRKARRFDRVARWVITLGGLTVIAGVVGILALIVGVTMPLFRAATSEVLAEAPLDASLSPSNVLALGGDASFDGRRVSALVWSADAKVTHIDMLTGKIAGQTRAQMDAADASLLAVEVCGPQRFSLLWSDGATSLVEAAVPSKEGEELALRQLAAVPADEGGETPRMAFLRRAESGAVTRVALMRDGISIVRQTTGASLIDEDEIETHRQQIDDAMCADIAAMTVDREGATIYAGMRDGHLVRWQLDEAGDVANRDVAHGRPEGRSANALTLLLGDMSLAVGDVQGDLSTWFPVRADGKHKLQRIHTLEKQDSPICRLAASPRNKALLSLGEDGGVHLDYATTERRMLSLSASDGSPIVRVAFGSRGDLVLGMASDGKLTAWRINALHPEVSWTTLFGKVHYEGYDEPAYVWQTTGGNEFEPKFSIIPLLFGTLKGTFYAMLLALPLALGGAAYVSTFTTPLFKNTIKPFLEVMAAVPSVVVGFLAALWLAPLLQQWALAFFLSLVCVPAVILGFLVVWQWLRRFDVVRLLEGGYEFVVMLPVLATGAALAIFLAGPLEQAVFGGNFIGWLFEGPLGIRYDPRNNIIIAFALGFAVVPIIFSIAEDSITSVPPNMAAASMALGASRWQTFFRVILPSASPGIFAAIMIGFGRAVGETMIVLMATGNTPILDWSPLNGMRTLSAGIAVEMPEAPVDGTLYRVLFLCAVLLFAMTFFLNTTAEVVRQRLRKRYGRL